MNEFAAMHNSEAAKESGLFQEAASKNNLGICGHAGANFRHVQNGSKRRQLIGVMLAIRNQKAAHVTRHARDFQTLGCLEYFEEPARICIPRVAILNSNVRFSTRRSEFSTRTLYSQLQVPVFAFWDRDYGLKLRILISTHGMIDATG